MSKDFRGAKGNLMTSYNYVTQGHKSKPPQMGKTTVFVEFLEIFFLEFNTTSTPTGIVHVSLPCVLVELLQLQET